MPWTTACIYNTVFEIINFGRFKKMYKCTCSFPRFHNYRTHEFTFMMSFVPCHYVFNFTRTNLFLGISVAWMIYGYQYLDAKPPSEDNVSMDDVRLKSKKKRWMKFQRCETFWSYSSLKSLSILIHYNVEKYRLPTSRLM